MKKKFVSLIACAAFALSFSLTALAAKEDITIFYTNDVHTYIDNAVTDENGLTYSKVAALKASVENAILVDAGDHIQGTAYGSMDNGSTIVRLMNAVGYDAATLGNHEFDYGMEGCLATVEAASYPYTSCNFYHVKDGTASDLVLNRFLTVEVGDKKVAFIGITTPETFTSSTPAYFQDENGNYIYGIGGGTDGSELYTAVQTAIDAARDAGSDYVIALGHLGIDASSSPWTSRDVIAHTDGLDAFIDGHSHSTVEMELVSDKSGDKVPLTQTGSYLNAIGKLTITADGSITSTLLSGEDCRDFTPNAEVKAIEDAWIAEIENKLGTVIGYSEVTLDNYDTDGNRLVRKQSTNSGDFAADALYYLFDEMDTGVDVAIMNGGGIRNAAITGELTYRTCKEIHTFGNVACLQKVTGQQLLDALEWGAKDLSAEDSVENGGFLQVSGLTYSIDPSIPSTVQKDENGIWTGSPTGAYRVQNVKIRNRETGTYEALDRSKTYLLAGYNYTLRNLGDGFAMFDGAVNVLDYVAEDYMVLANYIQSFATDEKHGLPTITADSGYADVNGSGRITIVTPSEQTQTAKTETQTTAETAATSAKTPSASTTYVVLSGDCLWKIARAHYGSGAKWHLIYEANTDTIKNPSLIRVGQVLTIPALRQ